MSLVLGEVQWRRLVRRTSIAKRSYFHRPWRACFCFAAPGGGAALRDRPSPWKDINGIGIFLPHSQHWFEFRRFTR
jgi:hypothetical protein